MTIEYLYRELCREAGTYRDASISAEEWFEASSHNVSAEMELELNAAVNGDVPALVSLRRQFGLPILV
jgi:hypothetical protein